MRHGETISDIIKDGTIDFDLWLYHIDDIQNIQYWLFDIVDKRNNNCYYPSFPNSRVTTTPQKKYYIKEFVLQYGLDWVKYYNIHKEYKHNEEYLLVEEQHKEMCNLYNSIVELNIWPKDIFHLIGSYVPWFYLVERELKSKK